MVQELLCEQARPGAVSKALAVLPKDPNLYAPVLDHYRESNSSKVRKHHLRGWVAGREGCLLTPIVCLATSVKVNKELVLVDETLLFDRCIFHGFRTCFILALYV